MKSPELAAILDRLADLHRRCPDMRLGQILATAGMLAEDSTGHSLWDVEDAEFAAALEKLSSDLKQRGPQAIGLREK